MLGLLAFFRDDLRQARVLLEQSIQVAREVGDLWCLADALGTAGSIYPLQGELDAAENAGTEVLRIARANNEEHGMRMSLFGLALTASRRGDAERTRGLGQEGLSICRAIGDPWFTSYFLWLLALSSLELGELGQARIEAEESFAIAKRLNVALLAACALEALGRVARAGRDADAAERHFAEGLAVAAAGTVPKSYQAAIHRARGELAYDRQYYVNAKAAAGSSLLLAREVGDAWEAEAASKLLRAIDAVI
jgi:tetratricopeptide (TPR) repeat protein